MKKKIIIISKILAAFWILLFGILLAFLYFSNKEEMVVSDPIATIFMVILGFTVLIFSIMFILEIVTSIKANEKYVFLKLVGDFIIGLFGYVICGAVLVKSFGRTEILLLAIGGTIFNRAIKYWKRK